MNKKEITSQIKSAALEVGFDKVGIAGAEPVKTASLLEQWLSLGYHGTMQWMANYFDKRTDPSKLFPDAKSVISVALNYYTPFPIPDDPKNAKISRYAWGDDYHDIMKDKLSQLLTKIQTIYPPAEGKYCVDTSPIMDKYWAAQAGIGWQGKNTNVITRDIGSWVFLGEILLNIELEYDIPIADYCGSCNRCIEACPTDAITQPYVVNSSKCISYLTIEYRGETFPNRDEEKLDNWIYGCDICQDVCPWNIKFAETSAVQGFQPREKNMNRNLEEWAKLSEEEFKDRFKKSPVKRAKFSGLIRNIMQALFEFSKR